MRLALRGGQGRHGRFGGEAVAWEFAAPACGERPFVAARVAQDAARPVRAGAYAAAFIAATLFSAKGIFAKKAYEAGATPDALLALRFLMAAPAFAWIAFAANRNGRLPAPTRRDWMSIALLGGGGMLLSSVLDFNGLRYISVGLERMILYTYPALVVLFSAWILRRRPSGTMLSALALSYAGLAVAFAGEASFAGGRALLLGGGLVFGASLAYALFLMGTERLSVRLGAQRLNAFVLLACTAMCVPAAFAVHGRTVLLQQPGAYAWAAVMALLGTVLPAMLTAHAIRRIGAARMSMAGTAGAVAALPLAAVMLGEPAGIAQWAGVALTVAGVAVLARRK